MSRIRTDLKPTVKGLKSSTSLTKTTSKSDIATKLPPVSPRCVSASPRGSVDLRWTIDMVRGYTLHGSEKTKAVGMKNSNSLQSNHDYEKLHQKFTSLQKLVNQLHEEIKVKNKTILDLQEKLTEKEEEYNKSLEKCKETISQHESKIENFYEQVKQLKDAIMERTKETDGVKIELDETKKKYEEKIENILKEVNNLRDVSPSENDTKIVALEQSYKDELASRDSKISMLKIQLESSLNHNSKERQRQLDELTKELTRVNDETELLKSKLRALVKQRQPEQCRNCMALEETLRVKLKELRSKDDSIAELLQHGQKMAKQLSKQDEFLKLCERASVNFQR